jgi:histone H2A
MPPKKVTKSKSKTPEPGVKQVSRSDKADVNFPVGRLHSMLRKKKLCTPRISAGTPVFMAATLEYLCAEILELAGNFCLEKHALRIKPRHIFLAIDEDRELGELFENALIAGGGVHEGTNPLLANKPKGKKKSQKAGPTMQA